MTEPNKSKIIIFVAAFIVLTGLGCDKTKENLQGLWYIQKATINGRDAIYQDFTSRNVSFLIDGSCVLPNPFRENFVGSKWNFIKVNDRNCIKIIAKTPYFNDIFRIDTLLFEKVILSNDSKYILMKKVY